MLLERDVLMDTICSDNIPSTLTLAHNELERKQENIEGKIIQRTRTFQTAIATKNATIYSNNMIQKMSFS